MRGRASCVMAWMLLGSFPAAAGGEGAQATGAATAIVAVEAAVAPDAVTVAIRGNGGLSPEAIRLVEHFRPRLVLDFPGLAVEATLASRIGIDPVDRIRVARQSVALTRVVVELSRSVPYRVETEGPGASTLRVVFPRQPASIEARVDSAPDVLPGPVLDAVVPPAGPAFRVDSVPDARLGPVLDAVVPPAGPAFRVADVPDVHPGLVLDAPSPAGPAFRVADAPDARPGPVLDAVVPPAGSAFRADSVPDARPGPVLDAVVPPAGPAFRVADAPDVLAGPVLDAVVPPAGPSFRADSVPDARPGLRSDVALAVGGRAPAAAARFAGQPPPVGRVYAGDPVSMDFQNADLRAVLRVFAEISALNLVIDPSVQGEVNVALTQVPWDQAFDVILRANGLGYEMDGTVVRIASIERLQEEAEARAALVRREAEAGELAVFSRTLSHARADDLVALVTGASLSSRGEVFTDPRTNTLIVRDLEDRLPALDVLLDTLDRSQPQVEIEARVVRAGHDSARALGVQWGLGARRDAAAGASGSEVRDGPDRRLASGVDLGVGAPTSILGVAIGPSDGPLDLDVTLTALESRGELRIISSPRVTTQNNVEAEILQGDQIPYQTVANNTVTVQFKEAALTLRVTPQITSADTVIMQVEVENSFADFARALGNPPIPSIVTQRAATTVQVRDGETAVIAGIYENTRSEQRSRTPGLHRVPVLGWLFRSSARNESTDELMIFLTPRIVP